MWTRLAAGTIAARGAPAEPARPRRGQKLTAITRAHALAAAAILAAAGAARAASTDPAIDPLSVTGRDFGGVRFSGQAQEGSLSFSAKSAAVWKEGSSRRLLLTGNVHVTLGIYEFDARRAAVWLEPASDADPNLWQAFVYFDRVGSSTANSAVAISADRLPVEGLVRSESIALTTDVRTVGRPDSAFVAEAERALTLRLRAAIGGLEWSGFDSADPLRPEEAIVPPIPQPEPAQPLSPEQAELLRRRAVAPTEPGVEPIFRSTGVISVGAGDAAFVPTDTQPAVLVTGGVSIQYWDRLTQTVLQLDAERAVVFLAPGLTAGSTDFNADQVEGIYLEGGVIATDGSYTVRGPRIYYDVANNKALVLDAVFWTYNRRIGMPLYLRAETIRQEAADQFRATNATFANTSFFKPHFSIGASTVTITQRPDTRDGADTDEFNPDGPTRTIVDADNIRLRAGRVPFLYWPNYTGDPENVPLRDLSVESSSGSGTGVTTAWSTWGLLGIEPPGDLDAETLIDIYSERGIGLGQRFDWSNPDSAGELFTYWLPDDNGTDIMATGAEIENNGESRGAVLGGQRWSLTDEWNAQLEVGYLSDERLAQAIFRDIAKREREVTNRVTLTKTENTSALSITAKAQAGDFTPNEYLLQSQGYTVDRYPDASSLIIGRDVLADSAPGLLTYYGESRISQMRMRFTDPLASEFGFTGARVSQEAFGIDPDESIADRLTAEGFTERPVTRLDTRQELTAQLESGPFKITPFVVGRATAYDDRFKEFSPDETDQVRLWGAAGVRIATALHRVFNDVDSRLLDIHRLRHTVEPSLTVWHAGTTIDQVDLPVYDDSVESIADGTIVTASIDQSLQTKRGGPGRWRSEDVFKLNTSLTWSSADADEQSPFGRYFDYRPELSNPGQYLTNRATWQPTGAVALVGESVADIEDGEQVTTAAGVRFQHNPLTTTTIELRYLNPLDSTRINLGSAYTLTDKYRGTVGTSYDTEASEFQTVRAGLERSFPNVSLRGAFGYNDTTGETSIGFSITPNALGRSGIGLSGGDDRRGAVGPLRAQ